MNNTKIILYLLCLVLCSMKLIAQEAPAYISAAYIKSETTDFLDFEKEHWVPVHKALIQEGRKSAWYLYRVKYPSGEGKEYDYVRFNIFTSWAQVEAPYAGLDAFVEKVHPAEQVDAFYARTNAGRTLVWEQLFQVIDQAAIDLAHPPKYIQVNEMKTVPRGESRYVHLERTFFKPFHAQRVSDGLMNNWWLCKHAMPYGTKYEADYVTFNGFDSWAAITAPNPPGFWGRIHSGIDFNEVHDEILSKRLTVSNEIWELVGFAVE